MFDISMNMIPSLFTEISSHEKQETDNVKV